jgi:membrane protease YdiL (CAAX protease family)
MAFQSGIWIYIADYIFRLAILLLLFKQLESAIGSPKQVLEYFHIVLPKAVREKGRTNRIMAWTLATTAYACIVMKYVEPWLGQRLPNTSLLKYPSLAGAFKIFDLSVGVALVAITEEAVFRCLSIRALSPDSGTLQRFNNKCEIVSPSIDEYGNYRHISWYAILVSCVLFGLIHWSLGVDAIISTTLWALLPTIALLQTSSLWPGLVAHYITDLLVLAELS